MKDKHSPQSNLTTAELKLLEQLRAHPKLLERFQSLLEISSKADGPVKRADEIEALLIEEMRRLGNATMESWPAEPRERWENNSSRKTHRLWYAKKNADEVGRRWGHCARNAGWGLNSQVHALADGAEWIRLQTREVFGTQGTFLCDFFHVSEYLGAAAPSCRAQAPERWRRTQQDRLKRGALEKVLDTLTDHLEPPGTAEELAPVNNAHRYLTNRKDCLDYPRAIGLGLPIGSGMIESGHRHVLQARLKKAGAAWLIPHADQIANLRVLRANGRWLALWN
jgi:hypothetical protein